MSARPLFEVVTELDDGHVAAAWLRQRLGPALHAVADALGCIAPAGIALSWPCDDDGAGCPRQVREDATHPSLPLVAVCGREDAYCEPVRLSLAEAARVRFSAEPLIRHVAPLLGVRGAWPARLAADDGRALVALGTETAGGRVRDVFFARRPRHPGLADALAARSAAATPSLVLLPTEAEPALHAAHGAGAHVALLALADVVVLEDGALRLVGPAPRPRDATGPTMSSGLPSIASWAELSIYRIDGHTVSFRAHGKGTRRTYLDVGMASAKSREPTKSWELLLVLCEGGGTFRWKDLGSHAVVKQRVVTLRKELRALFGLEDDPFEPFHMRDGWKARFVARDGDGEG